MSPLGHSSSPEIQVAYMCSILLQLAPGSRDLSQAEKRIAFMES